MIKMFRIDERLIHGQIAIKWSRHIGVDHIVVGNDAAANSPIIQKSLKMAAPAGIKTAIRGVDDAIALLNDPRCESMKILMLVNSPEDAERVVAAVSGIPYINIGNYGRIAPKQGDLARRTYGSNLYAYDEEVEDFKKVLSFGIDTVYQTTPEDNPEKLSKVLGL